MATGPLLVFDFDHTITDLNTDVEIQKLAPGGEIPASSEMRGLYTDKGWTEFMGAVFKLLQENGVKKEQIQQLMANLDLTKNMENLLVNSVEQQSATIIIISDSNSEFINHILKVRQLDHLVDKVFTNPASWAPDGTLLIQPYHHQEDCKLSTKNLCKGQIMEDYLKSCGKTFSYICYVGDGKNDFCPSLRLENQDIVCVRKGFSLENYIPKMEKEGMKIKAEILNWSDADQIYKKLVERSQ